LVSITERHSSTVVREAGFSSSEPTQCATPTTSRPAAGLDQRLAQRRRVARVDDRGRGTERAGDCGETFGIARQQHEPRAARVQAAGEFAADGTGRPEHHEGTGRRQIVHGAGLRRPRPPDARGSQPIGDLRVPGTSMFAPVERPRPRPPDDRLPHCRHFGTCGGCSLLDQPIAWQLRDKVATCERLLAPFLGSVPLWFDEPRNTPVHHRTKLLYPVRAGRSGEPLVGIYAYQSHHVVRIEECRTQDRWLTQLGQVMEKALVTLRLAPFSPARGEGHVKAIWARLAAGTGEVCAGIVTRPGAFPAGPAFAEAVLAGAAGIPQLRHERRLVGVVHGIRERDDDFLLADRHVPLRGRDHVLDHRDGLWFKVSAGSFYQVHAGAHANCSTARRSRCAATCAASASSTATAASAASGCGSPGPAPPT
jgi:hypothetical protein